MDKEIVLPILKRIGIVLLVIVGIMAGVLLFYYVGRALARAPEPEVCIIIGLLVCCVSVAVLALLYGVIDWIIKGE